MALPSHQGSSDPQLRVMLMERLVSLSETLTKQSSVAGVAQAIGRAALTLTDGQRVAVYLRSVNGVVTCPWSENLSQEYVNRIVTPEGANPWLHLSRYPDIICMDLPKGRRPATSDPTLLQDVRDLPQGNDVRLKAHREGYQALCSWPLSRGGRVIGSVTCYYDAPYVCSPLEREIMAAFSLQAAAALESAVLLEARAERAAQAAAQRARITEARHVLEAEGDQLFATKKDLATESTRLAAAQQELEAEHARLLALQNELKAEHARLSETRRAQEAEHARLAEARKELATEHARLTAARKELEPEHARLVEAQNRFEAENARLTEARRELAAESTRLTEARRELAAESTRLAARQKELEEAQGDADSTHLSKARQELEEEQARLAEAQRELQEEQARLTEARRELETENARVSEAQGELKADQARYAETRRELEGERERLAGMRRELEADQARLAKARDLPSERPQLSAAPIEPPPERPQAPAAQGGAEAEQRRSSEIQRALEAETARLHETGKMLHETGKTLHEAGKTLHETGKKGPAEPPVVYELGGALPGANTPEKLYPLLIERAAALLHKDRRTLTPEQQVLTLARALDARDAHRAGYSERLAKWAEAVAKMLECSDAEIPHLRRAALLHDIGKVGVPEHILRKLAALTDEELAVMREEPIVAERILRPVDGMQKTAAILRHRYEHWDGKGYPDALKGDKIPLGARILAAVDAYGEMTTGRPNQPMLYYLDAESTLRRFADAQFDPRVVEVFCRVLKRERQETA